MSIVEFASIKCNNHWKPTSLKCLYILDTAERMTAAAGWFWLIGYCDGGLYKKSESAVKLNSERIIRFGPIVQRFGYSILLLSIVMLLCFVVRFSIDLGYIILMQDVACKKGYIICVLNKELLIDPLPSFLQDLLAWPSFFFYLKKSSSRLARQIHLLITFLHDHMSSHNGE